MRAKWLKTNKVQLLCEKNIRRQIKKISTKQKGWRCRNWKEQLSGKHCVTQDHVESYPNGSHEKGCLIEWWSKRDRGCEKCIQRTNAKILWREKWCKEQQSWENWGKIQFLMVLTNRLRLGKRAKIRSTSRGLQLRTLVKQAIMGTLQCLPGSYSASQAVFGEMNIFIWLKALLLTFVSGPATLIWGNHMIKWKRLNYERVWENIQQKVGC